MTFYQLDCFVRAVECGSFAEVGQQLYVTQPAVTYQISNMENELNTTLFYRTRQGVVPTKPGKVLYNRAKKLLAQYDQVVADVAKAAQGSDVFLRIGFTCFPRDLELSSLLYGFSLENPEYFLDVNLDSILETSQQMHDGLYDLVFDYQYDQRSYEGMIFHPLGEDTFQVLMSLHHPLASQQSLTLADLKGYTVLALSDVRNTRFQLPTLEDLSRAGAEISVSPWDHNNLTIAVAAGRGVNIYPSHRPTALYGMKSVPLISQPPLRYGVLYRPERYSPALARLIDYLETHYVVN